MKKIVLTMLAIATFGTMMAQDNKEVEPRAPKKMTPEQVTERMTKDLDLNADQQAKVLDLNKEYEDVTGHPGMHKGPRGPRPGGMGRPENLKKADEAKKEVVKEKAEAKKVDGETGATNRPQRPERPQMTDAQRDEMKKRMERRKDYDGKLKEILTPEQFEKYQQQRQRHHHHGPRR